MDLPSKLSDSMPKVSYVSSVFALLLFLGGDPFFKVDESITVVEFMSILDESIFWLEGTCWIT